MKQGTSKPAYNGTYKFRIGPESGTMQSASKAKFAYHRFEFPVRGRHDCPGKRLPGSPGTSLTHGI